MTDRAALGAGSSQAELDKYLASPQFAHQITCPRTSSLVSFSQIGDPEGCPVLFIPPAVCSRWFAVPLDEICRVSGLKLISIDRPGCGSTLSVPIGDRLDISSKHILSVMEHLKMEARHIIAFSSGIYYALHLLKAHRKELGGMLQPIFVSPWVPPQSEEGEVMKPVWEPAMTTVPKLGFVVNPSPGANQRPVISLENIDPLPTKTNWGDRLKKLVLPERDGSDNNEETQTEWSKQVSIITTRYINKELHEGIADEISLSYTHGQKWLEEAFQALSDICKEQDRGMVPAIWYGTNDTTTTKKSHVWLQKMIESMPKMGCKSYKVEGADHMDLLWRDKGIKQVFAMIHFRERVYYGG